jgi:hypothetical protein
MSRDGWIGIGIILGCAWLYGDLENVPENPFVPIGPAFYPRLLIGLLAGLSAVLVLQDLLRPRPGSEEKAVSPAEWRRYGPTLVSFAAFFLYVLLLPVLGYRTSTLLFVGGLHWLLGPLKWRRLPASLGLGLATSLATYLVFERSLRVFLPRGYWIP